MDSTGGGQGLDDLKTKTLDLEDVDEKTDPDSLGWSKYHRFEAWTYIIGKIVWGVTIYVVFLGLIFYQKRFIDQVLLGIIPGESVENPLIFYTAAWLGFVVQVIGVVAIAIKHYFPTAKN